LTTGTFTSTGIDDNATSTAITIDASENVGIGTASPSNQLHLNTTAASNVIQLTNSATGTGAGDGMQIVTSSLEMQLRNREAGPTTFYTSNIERMTIASGGNVGIGTSSPANKLDVNGILQSSSVGNYLQLQQSSTDGYINMTGSGGLNFRMGSGFDTRMTIDSSGNVGIGTTATANTRVYVRTALATDVAYLADNSTNSGFKVKFNSGSTAILNDFNAPLIFGTNDTERMRIDASGNVGIGTTSPAYVLDVYNSAVSQISASRSGGSRVVLGTDTSTGEYVGTISNTVFKILTNSTERMRIDSSGNVGIGTTSPASPLHVKVATNANFEVENSSGTLRLSSLNDARSANSAMQFASSVFSFVTGNVGIGTTSPSYKLDVDVGAPGSSDQLLGRFSAQAGTRSIAFVWDDSASTLGIGTQTNHPIAFHINGSSAEKMRLDTSGNLLVGTTTISVGSSVNGFTASQNGSIQAYRSGNTVAYFNRNTNDGTIVSLRQADVEEGTIAVSGTTVSYNGGHLSRWSQSDINDVSTIYKGTVMSNLDEMCVWTNEDNEQLNKTKISDVEGDVNVAGVFVAEDNSDDLSDYYLAMTGDMILSDYYLAMTGDMIIRIAQGTTVQRGDLLMSAGDGTAKPQDDDIVRSKTIAKVTSTNVTCTYADGSYCVPCVLMAC
jgi:hypothetical protein